MIRRSRVRMGGGVIEFFNRRIRGINRKGGRKEFMSEREQILHLEGELQKVIERHRQEYDLTVASVVGVLEVVKFELMMGEMAK